MRGGKMIILAFLITGGILAVIGLMKNLGTLTISGPAITIINLIIVAFVILLILIIYLIIAKNLYYKKANN